MNQARFDSRRGLAGFCAVALVVTIVMVAASAPANAVEKTSKPVPSPSSPLDINKATADELTALPGIGPAMASRIVTFREEHGPFRRVEDLMRVKGIGEKSFEKLRSSIKVSKTR